MGTTILHHEVRADDPNVIESFFKSRSGGADNWGDIVDAYKEDTVNVGALLKKKVLRPDGSLSVGRGGRLCTDLIHAAATRVVWQRRAAVRKARQADELLIVSDALTPEIIKAVRAKLGRHLRRLIAENLLDEEAGR